MATAYRGAEGDPDRLMAALAAGQGEGGDIRGMQSAAIVVVAAEPTGTEWGDRLLDLRVEDHATPVDELARLVRLWRAYGHAERAEELELTHDLDGAMRERFAPWRSSPTIPSWRSGRRWRWPSRSPRRRSPHDRGRPRGGTRLGGAVAPGGRRRPGAARRGGRRHSSTRRSTEPVPRALRPRLSGAAPPEGLEVRDHDLAAAEPRNLVVLEHPQALIHALARAPDHLGQLGLRERQLQHDRLALDPAVACGERREGLPGADPRGRGRSPRSDVCSVIPRARPPSARSMPSATPGCRWTASSSVPGRAPRGSSARGSSQRRIEAVRRPPRARRTRRDCEGWRAPSRRPPRRDPHLHEAFGDHVERVPSSC